MFLQKEISHWRQLSYIFGNEFDLKMPENSDSMYSSIFMLENIWYASFTVFRQNSQEILNFVPIMGPRGAEPNLSKF